MRQEPRHHGHVRAESSRRRPDYTIEELGFLVQPDGPQRRGRAEPGAAVAQASLVPAVAGERPGLVPRVRRAPGVGVARRGHHHAPTQHGVAVGAGHHRLPAGGKGSFIVHVAASADLPPLGYQFVVARVHYWLARHRRGPRDDVLRSLCEGENARPHRVRRHVRRHRVPHRHAALLRVGRKGGGLRIGPGTHHVRNVLLPEPHGRLLPGRLGQPAPGVAGRVQEVARPAPRHAQVHAGHLRQVGDDADDGRARRRWVPGGHGRGRRR